MNQFSGWSTLDYSAAAMLDSSATSSVGSSVASSMVSLVLVTMSPSFVLTAQDLSQAFSRALGNSLPQILVAIQNQTSQLMASNVTASGSVLLSTCLLILHQDLLLGSLQVHVTSLHLRSFPPTVC